MTEWNKDFYPSKMEWNDFRKRAVRASDVSEYWYCGPKILVRRKVGEVETPSKIL